MTRIETNRTIKTIVLYMIFAFWGLSDAALFGQECDIIMKETAGFCYGMYRYDNRHYPLCYDRPTLPKIPFHLSSSERKYFIINAKRFSNGVNYDRVLLFDVEKNCIVEIDSCADYSEENNQCNNYIATLNDTLFMYISEDTSIKAFIVSPQMKPTVASQTMENLFDKLKKVEKTDFWCVSKTKNNLAYCNSRCDSIIIMLMEKNTHIVSDFGEVTGWINDSLLLYSKISVEGYGDFFYDLYEYDISKDKHRLILNHVDNVYDYYDGLLLFSTSHNKLSLARLDDKELLIVNQFDLSKQVDWIYSALIINTGEIIIGCDKHLSDYHYYKCILFSNNNKK